MAGPDYAGATLALVDESRVFVGQNDHTWLVLHKTASGGSALDIARYFAVTPLETSVHYIVGQDGAIVQAVLEKDGAGGNCCLEAGHAPYLPTGINLNVKTISIEHVDPATDNSTPLTSAQEAASFRLIADICRRNAIPERAGDASGGIIGHHDIAPISRARCPGNYPWSALWSFLGGGGHTAMVPTGWTDDGTTLTAPNGHRVVKGFRDWILSHNWDPADQPLQEEEGRTPVEYSNPGLGGGSRQIFWKTVLEWTPPKGVFVAAGGQELLYVEMHPSVLVPPAPPSPDPKAGEALAFTEALAPLVKAHPGLFS